MRRSLRRPKINVNFFFFQDIITAALGVILFIALILALRLDPEPETIDIAASSIEQVHAEKELTALLSTLVEKRKVLESIRSNATQLDKDTLYKQIEILRSEASTMAQAVAVKGVPIPGIDNSQAIDAALKGGKDEVTSTQNKTVELNEKRKKAEQAVSELENQIKDLEAKLLAQEELKNKIWLIPQSSGTSKEPLLITISSAGYELQRYGKKNEKKTVTGGNTSSLLRHGLKEFSKDQFYVVLYFKPSMLSNFESIRDDVSAQGFEVGTDVITEDTILDFSPPDL